MKLLLDTHILLCAAAESDRLPAADPPRSVRSVLVAEAIAEGIVLLTADELVGQDPGPIRRG